MSAREYNIIVHVKFIPGSLTAIVDYLSKKNPFFPKSFCPKIFHQLTSIVGKLWIDLFATMLCFTRPRRTDIQRRCPGYILGRHVGLCIPTTCTATQDPNQILVRRLHSTVDSPIAFRQAPWFQTLLNMSIEIPVRLPENRRLCLNNLCRMYSIHSRKHCVFMHGHYLKIHLGSEFVKETSSCIAAPIRSSTSAICDSKWSIFSWCKQRQINSLTVTVQHKTRHQQQYISYCFVEEFETRESNE